MGNSGSSQRDNGDRASRFSRRNNDAEAIELATSALDEEAGENICDDNGDGHLNNRANNAYQDHVAKAGQQNIEASAGQYEEAATNWQRARKAVASQDETDTLKILEEAKRPDSELLWEYTPQGRDNENSEYIRIHSSRNSPRGEQFVQPDPYNRRSLDKWRISKWQTEHSKKDTMRERREKSKLFKNCDISAVSSPIPIPQPHRSHKPVFQLTKETQGIIGRKWRSGDHDYDEDNDSDCDNNYNDDGDKNIGDDVDVVVDNDDDDKNIEEVYHEEKYFLHFKKCAYRVGNYATEHTNYATSLNGGVGDDDKNEELTYCRKSDHHHHGKDLYNIVDQRMGVRTCGIATHLSDVYEDEEESFREQMKDTYSEEIAYAERYNYIRHEQDMNLEQSRYNDHADITYSEENNQTQPIEASYNNRQHRVRDTDKAEADDEDDEEAYEQIDHKIHSKAVYNIEDQEGEDIPKAKNDANGEFMTNEYVNPLKIAYNVRDQKKGAAREINPIFEEPENQFMEADMRTRETEYWNSEYTSEDDHLFEYEQPERSQHKEILAKYPELRLNLSEDLVDCPTFDDKQDENQKAQAPDKKHKHKTKEKKKEEAKMKKKLKFGQLVRGIISKAKSMFASAKKEDEIKESASHVKKKKKKKLPKGIKSAKCDAKRAKPRKNTHRYMGSQDDNGRLLDPKQYDSLAHMKHIRQENASKEIRISHVRKTVDTWNKPNPGSIYSPQTKNEWQPVLDQRKYGSLAHCHQAEESNPEMFHYINQARTQLSTWQSKSQINVLQKEPRQSDSDANRDHIRQMKATVKTAKSTIDSELQNPQVTGRRNDSPLSNWSRHFTNYMYMKNGNSNGILRNLDSSKLGGDDHPGNTHAGRQADNVKTGALETTNKARHVRSDFLNDDQRHKYSREPRRNKAEFTNSTTDFVDDGNQHRSLLGASDHRKQMIRIASDFIVSEHPEQNRSDATQNQIHFSREMSDFLKNENEIKDLCKLRRQSIVEDLDLVKEAHKRREQHIRKRLMTDLHVAPEFFAQENGESPYFSKSRNKMKDPQNPGRQETDETNKTRNLVEEARQRRLKQRYVQTKTDLHIPYEFLRNEKTDRSGLLKSENEIKDQQTVRKQEMGEEHGKLDIMEEAHRRREKQCHRHNMTDLHISPELLSNDRQCNTMAVTPAFLKEDFKHRYPVDPKQMAGKIADSFSVSIHQKEMQTARQRSFDLIPNINDLSTDLYFEDNHISSKEEGKHAAKRQLGESKNSTCLHQQQQQQQGLTRSNRAENFSVRHDDKPGINLQRPEEEKTQCRYRLPLPTRLFPDSGTGGFEDRQ